MEAAFVLRDNLGHRRDIEEAYLEAIDAAREEVVIASAYFLPGRHFRRALMDAAHIIMVVNQKLNTGLAVPFFGRPAFTSPAVVSLAMRYGCPVFPVRTERLPEGRYLVSVEEPFTFGPGDESALRAGLTQVNQRLEQWIRKKPGQGLWMHRRWPD